MQARARIYFKGIFSLRILRTVYQFIVSKHDRQLRLINIKCQLILELSHSSSESKLLTQKTNNIGRLGRVI